MGKGGERTRQTAHKMRGTDQVHGAAFAFDHLIGLDRVRCVGPPTCPRCAVRVQTFDFLNDLRLKHGSDATGIALVSGFEVFSSAQPTPFWVNEVSQQTNGARAGWAEQSAGQSRAAESPLSHPLLFVYVLCVIVRFR
jgi:hypothetical protein